MSIKQRYEGVGCPRFGDGPPVPAAVPAAKPKPKAKALAKARAQVAKIEKNRKPKRKT